MVTAPKTPNPFEPPAPDPDPIVNPVPEVTTIKMVRNQEQYPYPWTADVHPDEVENWKFGGWLLEGEEDNGLVNA